MRDRWRAGILESAELSEEWKQKLSRRTRVQDLADLLHRVAG
jgi:hypothetical protein